MIGAPLYQYSFPSGHAALAGLLVGVLWPTQGFVGRVVLVLTAATVMASRVVVGAHFPADVVAGAVLGVLVPSTVSVLLPSGIAYLGNLLSRPKQSG